MIRHFVRRGLASVFWRFGRLCEWLGDRAAGSDIPTMVCPGCGAVAWSRSGIRHKRDCRWLALIRVEQRS